MTWPYIVLKVLHLTAVVVAFGSLLSTPLLRKRFLANSVAGQSAADSVAWYRTSLWLRRSVSEPAFVLVGVLGVALAIANPNPDMFSLLWVKLALGLFAFALLVVLGLQAPLARRCTRLVQHLADVPTDAPAAKQLAFSVWALDMLTAVSAFGMIGMLVLMITQPT